MPELRGVYFKNDKTQSLPLFPSESSEGRWVFELRDALMRGDALRAAAAFHNANKTDLLLGLVEAHSSVCFWDEMAFYLMFADWVNTPEEQKRHFAITVSVEDQIDISGQVSQFTFEYIQDLCFGCKHSRPIVDGEGDCPIENNLALYTITGEMNAIIAERCFSKRGYGFTCMMYEERA